MQDALSGIRLTLRGAVVGLWAGLSLARLLQSLFAGRGAVAVRAG